ncbi:antizyme inhibitor 2 isoform X3 [Falco biarmicus]|uniref:antizyme inhibitor 2 isoform X3 n=1 Tax=Falco rusticolus TaxID=120794 RepID=UPI0006B7B293|nr:antizyme inhibitor 2 isoform X3 [Falco rusticolus]XP_055559404.1 antizyme inhibitor 2 isoform X3 [Falco cherrug]XP_056186595.1 antizyme inhibitor 2 isoform X3 [Falco biarmicus]
MNGYLNESNFMMVEEGFTTRDLLENILVELCRASNQQAFFVADLGDIVKKHLCFLKALPRVKPYFPVKCNSSEGVIRLLAELGAGFACTNKVEIARVQNIGVPADKIFYSSPCKQVAHIKYAASHGVQLMTFDNEVELSKVARSHPRARMLLGIAADSSPSAHPSMAFGTTLESCRHLLETAKEQAVEVVGIRRLRGGDCCKTRAILRHLRLHLCCQHHCHGREEDSVSKKSLVYHLSDGIHGTFSCLLFDSPCPSPQLHKRPCPDHPSHSSSLRGPPGHAEDHIADGLELPELQVGDWLIFKDMGAYTIASSAPLGGCPQPQITYAMSRVAWKAVQLFLGKPPAAEDDRETLCAPLSCGWETAEAPCITPALAPASII